MMEKPNIRVMFTAVIQAAHHDCKSEHDIQMCDVSNTSGAAGSSLLLNHLLYLPVSPLQDLHPFGVVPFSLLRPELVHILKEPVPATTGKFHHHDMRKHLRILLINSSHGFTCPGIAGGN